MSKKIADRDISLLWGRAGGRCSKCNMELAPLLESGKAVLLGEMCHVIARSADGPRGSEQIPLTDRNKYENLILLCPTDHTRIDRAPGDFTVEQILHWKRQHEASVARRLTDQAISSKRELMRLVLGFLNENRAAWSQFGPESSAARRNPLTSAVDIWRTRKLTTIIPNNELILTSLSVHRGFLSPDELATVAAFREHAIAFERSTFHALEREAQPRFPQAFRTWVEDEVARGDD